ncbi:MAG TPA: hypothetical protein PK339_11590 [Flavitalea sp.]|nr:hypothetical protein [Flavitalea sp.]
MIRKTAHRYPKAGMKGIFGQVGEDATIESGWLGAFEPNMKSAVSCYITEMMEATGQHQLIEKYAMQLYPYAS